MQDIPSVHFWGPWAPEERRELAEAIDAFEARHNFSAAEASAGRPWVAVIHSMPERGRYFFASRIGLTRAFTGMTLSELSGVIQAASIEDYS